MSIESIEYPLYKVGETVEYCHKTLQQGFSPTVIGIILGNYDVIYSKAKSRCDINNYGLFVIDGPQGRIALENDIMRYPYPSAWLNAKYFTKCCENKERGIKQLLLDDSVIESIINYFGPESIEFTVNLKNGIF